jgi:hypothetical protein
MIEDLSPGAGVTWGEFAANTSTYANYRGESPTMTGAPIALNEGSHTEPIITLVDTNPHLIAPLVAEILDAIIAADSDNPPAGTVDDGATRIIDEIIRELDPNQRYVIRAIAAIADAQEAATATRTFCEWLAHAGILRNPVLAEVYEAINNDPNWPRMATTYAEIRDHLATAPDAPSGSMMFIDEAWAGYYRDVIAPVMVAATVSTDIQYAVRIMFPGGHDEIHPSTVEGTTWYQAEQIARHHNLGNREGADPGRSFATVIRRTAVRGPWYSA